MNDIISDDFLVTLTGCQQILIENYKEIKSYDAGEICILGKKRRLTIYGEGLTIQYYSYETMKVIGTIRKLEYESGGNA